MWLASSALLSALLSASPSVAALLGNPCRRVEQNLIPPFATDDMPAFAHLHPTIGQAPIHTSHALGRVCRVQQRGWWRPQTQGLQD